MLEPFGVPLPTAATVVAEAMGLVGTVSDVLVACRDHARRNPTGLKPMLVADAVEQFLDSKRKDNLRPRSIRDLELRLRRFAGGFPGKSVAAVH